MILRKLLKKYSIIFYIGDEDRELKILRRIKFIKSDYEIHNFNTLKISVSSCLSQDKLISILIDSGYLRVDFVEKEGEFSRRGNILDIYPDGYEYPVRIEYDGDIIESIRAFDVYNQRSFMNLKEIDIVIKGQGNCENFLVVREVVKPVRKSIKLVILKNELENIDISYYLKKGYRVYFATSDRERAKSVKKIYKEIKVIKGEFSESFIDVKKKIALFSLGFHGNLRSYKVYKTLSVGDLVVHKDYGIGKFLGTEVRGIIEFFKIQYKDGVLFVPIYNLHFIKKYFGDKNVEMSSLSDNTWKRVYKKAYEHAKKQASIIISKLSIRKSQKGFKFKRFQEEEILKLTFPYEETQDQKKAIEEVLSDMESEKVVDRLIVGDVGFGKTEIIIRASLKAVLNNKQVAVLVPTTVLAYQHYRNFKTRLERFGVEVRMLSRLTLKEEVRKIKEGLRRGSIDIVIGTHKLLSKDIVFRDLGLLVVDEEHKFGVLQKEKLRNLNLLVDTIYLSATPIPRTLASALKGLLDISIIRTPPKDRKDIRTFVYKYSDEIVKNAISNELIRKGQVFYVYNRIDGIYDIFHKLQNMFKGARIRLIHGRMKRNDIESVFLDFYEQKIDILVSTNIIDAGLDFPNANTIIVHRAEILGLSELHQLRGRVGRSDKQAYAYFLIEDDNLNENAIKRLKVIENFSYLGSGYDIALSDLEIRGAGNIFGFEQSGHAHNVGFYLYLDMLEKAIYELRNIEYSENELEIKVPAYIPKEYIEDEEMRIYFYEKIVNAKFIKEIEIVEEELKDRFGDIPKQLENLIKAFKLKLVYSNYKKVIVEENNVILLPYGRVEAL
ncbi:MAG: DEAD/DEAH box helicase [candidate division WOR-3 bacterium]|nr:DEAD/DEAH box helicase [candidate division WOR-3 bacterium]